MKRVCVIVATVGRPEALRTLLGHLQRQTLQPQSVILSIEKAEDCPALDGLTIPIKAVYGPRGLCQQRNRGLDASPQDSDIVAFFDDDYVPSRYALEGIVAAFERFPAAGGMNGVLLADGINGPGIDLHEAARTVEAVDLQRKSSSPNMLGRLQGLYGCNMVYRASAIGGERFDEALPLYGWQEDIDFSARLKGDKIKTDAFYGVHCGTKSGRETKGKRLGYSQIANNWYLLRKGTMTPRHALGLASSNVVANHLKMLNPEPWIDRRARAAGNWAALADLVRGRCTPARMLKL